MTSNEHDDLTGIFDNATPEDIISAPRSTVSSAFHSYITDMDFDDFVESMLNSTRFAYASCDGVMNIVAALLTETSVYYFKAEDDDTMGSFEDRVADEARNLRANAVFITQKTTAGVITSAETLPVDNPEGLEEARLFGDAHEAMLWYASHVSGRTRIGFIVSLGQYLGQNVEGDGRQPFPRFARLLPNGG